MERLPGAERRNCIDSCWVRILGPAPAAASGSAAALPASAGSSTAGLPASTSCPSAASASAASRHTAASGPAPAMAAAGSTAATTGMLRWERDWAQQRLPSEGLGKENWNSEMQPE